MLRYSQLAVDLPPSITNVIVLRTSLTQSTDRCGCDRSAGFWWGFWRGSSIFVWPAVVLTLWMVCRIFLGCFVFYIGIVSCVGVSKLVQLDWCFASHREVLWGKFFFHDKLYNSRVSQTYPGTIFTKVKHGRLFIWYFIINLTAQQYKIKQYWLQFKEGWGMIMNVIGQSLSQRLETLYERTLSQFTWPKSLS